MLVGELADIMEEIEIENKDFKIYDYDFVKRYADQHYYAFTRGKVLIVISDGTPDENIIEVTKHGFN